MMERRPLIGVPAQTLQAIDGIPADLPHSWVMNHRYFTALALAGAAPVMVPLLRDDVVLRSIYDGLDGVFIAGGVDMDPSSYGQARAPQCGSTDLDRDHVELLFVRWAVQDGKPVFGVCRGLQVMGVAAGGSLYQDCDAYYAGAIKHDYFPTAGYARDHLAHAVALAPGSRLHGIFGSDEVLVNSMHHQALVQVPDGYTATAVAPDGLVEAMEAPGDAFRVGVQWHPEMLIERDAATRRLFNAFIEAAAAYRIAATGVAAMG